MLILREISEREADVLAKSRTIVKKIKNIIALCILDHTFLGGNFDFIEIAREKQPRTKLLILIGCYKIAN